MSEEALDRGRIRRLKLERIESTFSIRNFGCDGERWFIWRHELELRDHIVDRPQMPHLANGDPADFCEGAVGTSSRNGAGSPFGFFSRPGGREILEHDAVNSGGVAQGPKQRGVVREGSRVLERIGSVRRHALPALDNEIQQLPVATDFVIRHFRCVALGRR